VIVPGNRLHELAATVALIRSQARPVPVDRLATLIEHAGSAVELVNLKLEDVLFSSPERDLRIAGTVSDEEVDRALREVEEWEARSLDVRSVLDPGYPTNLRSIHDRPPLIFIAGRWDESRDWRAAAVVGTRSASEAGLQRAARVTTALCREGFVIYSGLALGIDTAVHRAALDAGGITHAVMGTGLDHRHPASNRDLADEILEADGALLSQFFPHQTPRRWMFPQRNVVMSGLSLATVVVEAGATSGARIQARVALEHGRAVFLLRDVFESQAWARQMVEGPSPGLGAQVVDSPEEILERLRFPAEIDLPALV
jgi:DNA processing protein